MLFSFLFVHVFYGQDTSTVITSDVTFDTLRIVDIGTPSDDQLSLSLNGTNLIIQNPGNTIIGDGTMIDANTRSFALTDFTSILIETRTGSDSVSINAPLSFSSNGGMRIEGTTTVLQNATMTLAYGELSFVVSHTITFSEEAIISCSATATVELITQADIDFNGSIVNNANTSGGNISFVAGWDGITPFNVNNFNAYSSQSSLTATTPFGQNNRNIRLGDGNQSSSINLGNRFGQINLFANDITLTAANAANNRFVQIGYRSTDQGNSFLIGGSIQLRAKRNLSLQSGTNNAFNYTQIGHIGADLTLDTTPEANVNAPIGFAAGNLISVNGGQVLSNYSQLGHGGFQSNGIFNGAIQQLSVKTRLELTDNNNTGYSRLGHDQ